MNPMVFIRNSTPNMWPAWKFQQYFQRVAE